MPAPPLDVVGRTLYRSLFRAATAFDRNPALKGLVCRNTGEEPLPEPLDTVVAAFLGGEKRSYYWPAPAWPAGGPSLASAVASAFRFPPGPPSLEGGFQGLRYLSALLSIAGKHGMHPAPAAAAAPGGAPEPAAAAALGEVVAVPESGLVLLAHPCLGGWFSQAAVLLCSHSPGAGGSYGLAINKPLGATVRGLSKRISSLQPGQRAGGAGGGGGGVSVSVETLSSLSGKLQAEEEGIEGLRRAMAAVCRVAASEAVSRYQPLVDSLAREAGLGSDGDGEGEGEDREFVIVMGEASDSEGEEGGAPLRGEGQDASLSPSDSDDASEGGGEEGGGGGVESLAPQDALNHLRITLALLQTLAGAGGGAVREEEGAAEGGSANDRVWRHLAALEAVAGNPSLSAADAGGIQTFIRSLYSQLLQDPGTQQLGPAARMDAGGPDEQQQQEQQQLGSAAEWSTLEAAPATLPAGGGLASGTGSGTGTGSASGPGSASGSAHSGSPPAAAGGLMALFSDSPVFRGGPVPGVQVLHSCEELGGEAVLPPSEGAGGVWVGAALRGAPALIARGRLSPGDVKIFLGDSAWAAAQLEAELAGGMWALARLPPRLLRLFGQRTGETQPPPPAAAAAAAVGDDAAPPEGRQAAPGGAADGVEDPAAFERGLWAELLAALGPGHAALAAIPPGVHADLAALRI